MILKDTAVAEIVKTLQEEFATFGGTQKGDGINPVTHWAEGQPAQFAAGVEVAAVVRAVARELGKRWYSVSFRSEG